MTNPDCDICQGSGRIWLHVRKPILASQFRAGMVPIDQLEMSQREYACPECGDIVPNEKLVIVESAATVDSRITEPGFQDHVRGSVAAHLGQEMLKAGLITFDKSPGAEYSLTYQVRGKVGVASQRVLATLEQRISQREPEIAAAIVAEAYEEIGNWPEINKAQARSIIKFSAAKVMEQRRAAREAK